VGLHLTATRRRRFVFDLIVWCIALEKRSVFHGGNAARARLSAACIILARLARLITLGCTTCYSCGWRVNLKQLNSIVVWMLCGCRTWLKNRVTLASSANKRASNDFVSFVCGKVSINIISCGSKILCTDSPPPTETSLATARCLRVGPVRASFLQPNNYIWFGRGYSEGRGPRPHTRNVAQSTSTNERFTRHNVKLIWNIKFTNSVVKLFFGQNW